MSISRGTALAAAFGAVAALVLSSLSACVERKEHLKISPQGSVEWHVTHETDSLSELYEGDAVPRIAGGWFVEQQEVPKPVQAKPDQEDNGPEVKYLLIADAIFPPAQALPSNYGLPTEGDADLYLQFPTTVTIEDRADGVYYHFARTYESRPWAQIELLRKALVDEPLKELDGVDPRFWTTEQRIAALHALASFETEKALIFARAAFKHASPDGPQDAWLLVRQHMRDCIDLLNYEDLAKLLEPRETREEESARGQAIAAEIKRFELMQVDHLKDALRTQAGYGGAQIKKFFVEFERQKKAYAITEDLGDDQFTITVEMPGEIIASNADSTARSTGIWVLNGSMFRDREVELMATSRVAP
jgi:hypothetical protein